VRASTVQLRHRNPEWPPCEREFFASALCRRIDRFQASSHEVRDQPIRHSINAPTFELIRGVGARCDGSMAVERLEFRGLEEVLVTGRLEVCDVVRGVPGVTSRAYIL